MIKLRVTKDEPIKLKVSDVEMVNAVLKTDAIQSGVERDYNKLINLPTLNGVTIKGDMYEVDPNVEAISLADLANMFENL